MEQSSRLAEALLTERRTDATVGRKKNHIGFGYLPLWSELVPLDESMRRIDWPDLVVNIGSGFIMGIRETLGGIVSASLIFSSSDIPEITMMLPWGISMTLYTMTVGVLWYALFGRLQYGYATQQDLICILQAEMASRSAKLLEDTPEKIPATVVAIICTSSFLAGLASVLTGKLRLGSYMLYFPTPVINGFLGAIGVVVVRAGMQTASGVKFHFFYPIDADKFFASNSVAQVACALVMVLSIRLGPRCLNRCFPKSVAVKRLGGLVCQLIPLLVFYIVIVVAHVSMTTLADLGWTYPDQGNSGPLGLWTTYKLEDVDWMVVNGSLPDMPAIVLMTVMCTMVGALAIVDNFPTGPKGDPSPQDTLDFDTELATVGTSSMLLGCTGGNLNFHKFSVIQLRLDGGTHRISVLMIALLAGGLFLSGAPIGHLVPKWYLAGLFINTGIHFLKGTLLSYKSMAMIKWKGRKLPSPQYSIAIVSVSMAIFFSPQQAILTGLGLSFLFFLVSSSSASPVINVAVGDRVVSRSKRPFWEMRTLRAEGHRILMLYLQGQLFFGSTHKLAAALNAAAADDHVRFVILSLARVPRIDPSAVRHLKISVDKLRQRNCEVIFCRMNQDVFSTLSAGKVVKAPGEELLKHLQNLRWKIQPMQALPKHSPSPYRGPGLPTQLTGEPLSPARRPFVSAFSTSPAPLSRTRQGGNSTLTPYTPLNLVVDEMPPLSLPMSFVTRKEPQTAELIMQRPDAFCHETDALDYCDDLICGDFCYGASTDRAVPLTEYMLAYRAAVSGPCKRLPDWAFEDMNDLPRGLLSDLKPFCQVHDALPAWTKVTDMMKGEGALLFVLKGSLSVVQMMPISDGTSSSLTGEVAGFSFREGKKLLKRYPPGHVAGKDGFFLKHSGRILDPQLDPKYVVSSKMGPPAEIWILEFDTWETLPAALKGPLTEMLCVQFADDTQHSRFQEH